MDFPIELLKNLDLTNLLAMAAMLWFLYSRIDKKFDKIDERLNTLEKDNKEIRTSLNRMEGAFYSKECCMLKDDKQVKKVE